MTKKQRNKKSNRTARRGVEIPSRVLGRMHARTDKLSVHVPRIATPCWVLNGVPNGSGHGQVTFSQGGVGYCTGAHVISYRVFRLDGGDIPEGKLVCHSCDVKRCWNPDHLYLGSAHDNQRDRYKRGSFREQVSRWIGTAAARTLLLEEDDTLSRYRPTYRKTTTTNAPELTPACEDEPVFA